MQYALVNNIRKEASRGEEGICPICSADMVAKCGPRIKHHWAHKHPKDCDPWWENETEWHRNWKNLFPEECREVSHSAPDGEIHRADVKTSTGIVIEFQNSPMSDQERISRESFYGNLVWIINGEKFKGNFDIYHRLPCPNSEIAKNLVWIKSKRGLHVANDGIFWKRTENPDAIEGQGGYWIHPRSDIEKELKKAPSDYFQFDWIRPRKTWLEAKCPVYIDFGDEFLILLTSYETQKHLPCIRFISKKKFIYDANHESLATMIGTKFFPINK